jgi:hypothetical protein
MLQLLQKVKDKAMGAIQGAANFVDQDKSMGGVQLAQGGLGNRINSALTGLNQANQNASNWAINQPAKFTSDQAINFGRSFARDAVGLGQSAINGNAINFGRQAPFADETPVSSLFPDNRPAQTIADILMGPEETIRTPKGTGDLLNREYGVPLPVGIMLGLAAPASNFIPGGATKKAGTEVLEQGVKNYAPEVISGVTRKAPSLIDDVARFTEKVGITKVIDGVSQVADAGKQVDSAVHPALVKELVGEGYDQKAIVGILNKAKDKEKLASNPAYAYNYVKKVLSDQKIVPTNLLDDATNLFQENKGVKLGEKTSTTKGVFQDAVLPSKKVISDSGESGKTIRTLLDTADEEGALTGGAQQDIIRKGLNTLSKEEKITLADVIEGKVAPMSDAQALLVAEWKKVAADIRERATAAGLDVGNIENYFPHHNIVGNKKTAGGILSRSAERRYGNLEMARQTDLPYDKDPTALIQYIELANKRIADAKYFGKDDQVLYNLANKVADEGGDSARVVRNLDQILNKNQNKELNAISQGVRTVETVSKLGPLSSLTNLTQNLSTMMRTDSKSMYSAIKLAISNPEEAISNAVKAGELPADMARVLDDYSGSGNIVSKWLHIIGFSGAEKINRILGVNAGIAYTNKLLGQAKSGSQSALRELTRLGFDIKDLNKIEPIVGGRRISQATQFSTKAGELPYGWATPIGKMLTQFKSFAYKQTGLLGSEAKRISVEAKSGNFKPLANTLATYGVAAPIVGEVLNNIRSIVTNKEREDTDTLTERYISNILAATSFGLLDSTSGLFGKFGEAGVVSSALGPAAGDVVKIGDTVANIASPEEYNRNRAIRNIVRPIPAIGATLANTFVPNSYVDNQDIAGINLGVNNGLNQTDSATYKDIKNRDQSSAELFKTKQQDNRGVTEPNAIQSIFNKVTGADTKTPTIPSKDSTAADKKVFNDSLKKVMDEGVVPTTDELSYYVFNQKTANTKTMKDKVEVYKNLKTAMDNELYTEEQKKAILDASGASADQYDYYSKAVQPEDVKIQELIGEMGDMSKKENFAKLMLMRATVAGNERLPSGVITYLYERDYISKEQKEVLNGLKFDENTGEFYFTKAYQKANGFGSEGGSGSGSGKKLTYNQALELYSMAIPKMDMSKLYKPMGNSSSEQVSTDRRLIDSILSGPK